MILKCKSGSPPTNWDIRIQISIKVIIIIPDSDKYYGRHTYSISAFWFLSP
jgi:hypothetical protein